jgi:RHS repeat-associated protein
MRDISAPIPFNTRYVISAARFAILPRSITLLCVRAKRERVTVRERDTDSGFDYYRARTYDSQVGRSCPKTRSDLGRSVNLYSYVKKNNPVNFKDPSGKITIPVVVVGGIAIFEIGLHGTLGALSETEWAGLNTGEDFYGRRRHCWINCVSSRLHTNPAFAEVAGLAKEAVNLSTDWNNYDDSLKDIEANHRGQFLAGEFWRSCTELCTDCQPVK